MLVYLCGTCFYVGRTNVRTYERSWRLGHLDFSRGNSELLLRTKMRLFALGKRARHGRDTRRHSRNRRTSSRFVAPRLNIFQMILSLFIGRWSSRSFPRYRTFRVYGFPLEFRTTLRRKKERKKEWKRALIKINRFAPILASREGIRLR